MRPKTLRLLGILFLLIGISVYLFFQQESRFLSPWLSFLNIRKIDIENPTLRLLVCDHLADFCWSSAFVFFVQSVLVLNKKQAVYLLSCCGLGAAFELMQYFGIVSGTADILDMLAYFLGALTAVMIIITLKSKEDHHEKKN